LLYERLGVLAPCERIGARLAAIKNPAEGVFCLIDQTAVMRITHGNLAAFNVESAIGLHRLIGDKVCDFDDFSRLSHLKIVRNPATNAADADAFPLDDDGGAGMRMNATRTDSANLRLCLLQPPISRSCNAQQKEDAQA
jgi:hypothetical protein